MRLKFEAPIVFVHGGAGSWKAFIEANEVKMNEILNILSSAALKGYERIVNGGSALDAVVDAVVHLESSGVFNAGVGSVLDVEGKICMDAGVMFSEHSKAGAVACVRYPKNPVILARKIMEITDHVIICCEGADNLARKLNLEPHPGPTERALSFWEKARERMRKGEKPREWWNRNWELLRDLGILGDTVGAVALDTKGRLAAAASTGGISFKLSGRVGDSCIPGAGFYASRIGAAAATGIGETILMSMLTLRSIDLLSLGTSGTAAAKAALNILEKRFGTNTAGLILVSNEGEVASAVNTEGMPRALMAKGLDKPITAVWPEDAP